MGFIKSIVTISDLSQNSYSAIAQSIVLSDLLNVSVQMVTFVKPTEKKSELPLKLLFDLKNIFNLDIEKDEKVEGRYIVNEKINLFFHTRIGEVNQNINQFLNSYPDPLLIIGRRKNHDAFDQLLGSISTMTMEEAHCPVLIVPSNINTIKIHHGLFCVSEYSVNGQFLPFVLNFCKLVSSQINYIHVDVFVKSSEEVFHAIQQRIISEKLPLIKSAYHKVQGLAIANELNQFGKNNNIDLIITVKNEKGFFKNLLNQHVSRDLSHLSNIPILILK